MAVHDKGFKGTTFAYPEHVSVAGTAELTYNPSIRYLDRRMEATTETFAIICPACSGKIEGIEAYEALRGNRKPWLHKGCGKFITLRTKLPTFFGEKVACDVEPDRDLKDGKAAWHVDEEAEKKKEEMKARARK